MALEAHRWYILYVHILQSEPALGFSVPRPSPRSPGSTLRSSFLLHNQLSHTRPVWLQVPPSWVANFWHNPQSLHTTPSSCPGISLLGLRWLKREKVALGWNHHHRVRSLICGLVDSRCRWGLRSALNVTTTCTWTRREKKICVPLFFLILLRRDPGAAVEDGLSQASRRATMHIQRNEMAQTAFTGLFSGPPPPERAE